MSKHGITGPLWFEDGKTISGFSRMGLLPVQPTLPWSGLITISSKDCQSMPRLSGSPHSLDLNPIDFYLRECLKDHAYENTRLKKYYTTTNDQILGKYGMLDQIWAN